MSDFLELEYKYKADEIKLTDFLSFVKSLKPVRDMTISSWDHYYTKPDIEQGFVRYRQSHEDPELTKKVKVNTGNNWHRVEVDIPLDVTRTTEVTIDKFLELEGYINKTSIYKTSFIYWLDDVNYVYYIVYDKNLNEKGRFIEVEVNKKKVTSLANPVDTLNMAAKELEKIGIGSQNRMKKSLFEIFVK